MKNHSQNFIVKYPYKNIVYKFSMNKFWYFISSAASSSKSQTIHKPIVGYISTKKMLGSHSQLGKINNRRSTTAAQLAILILAKFLISQIFGHHVRSNGGWGLEIDCAFVFVKFLLSIGCHIFCSPVNGFYGLAAIHHTTSQTNQHFSKWLHNPEKLKKILQAIGKFEIKKTNIFSTCLQEFLHSIREKQKLRH